MKRDTKLVNGQPRTKGIRNPFVESARAHNTTPHKHKTERRAKDARRVREAFE